MRLDNAEIPDLASISNATNNINDNNSSTAYQRSINKNLLESVTKTRNQEKVSVTEFPIDGSAFKTSEKRISPIPTIESVKRVLIPESDSESEQQQQQQQLLGFHDGLLDDLSEAKYVLQQLQTVVGA